MSTAEINKVAKLLSDVDSTIIVCRGDHHPWPVLWARGRVPRGTRYTPSEVQGVYYVTQTCPNCTRVREKLLSPGERWRYSGGGKNFSAEPASERAELSRADYSAELYRRINESLG